MKLTRIAAAFLGLGLAAMPGALLLADGGRAMPASMPKSYVQECGSCHVAYPPGLLPAPSWKRIMAGLQRHYGTDASLDAATLSQLDGWLKANAASGRRAAEVPREDRITRSAWFESEHRKVDPSVWRLASVKSAANCSACHSKADQGRFSERELVTPAGMDARLRRGWGD